MQLEDLLAERDIQRALYRIARAMDERDWAQLDAVVAADVSADLGLGPLSGRAALVALMRSFLDACGPTQHLLGNVVIDVDGDEAESRCYVSDLHLGAGERSNLTFSTLGEYHDRWRRLDGVWRLVRRRKLTRAHVGSMAVLGEGPG